jgi:CRP/FNR family transcriptional regulator, anaerobic regulatory protein
LISINSKPWKLPREWGQTSLERRNVTLQRRTGCLNCAVRDQALCQVLSPADLAKLNRQAYHKRFSAGQLLTGLTAAQGWCATILSGVVKLTKSLPDGRQQIVGLLFPADFLGRPWGRSLSTNSACWQAEAVTALELCCYSTHAFEQLLAEQPNLKQLFLQRTLDAVDAAHEWMLLLGCKRASERVAALLLMLAQRLKPPNGATTAKPLPPLIELPLSRADIAEYLGLRLETVSRQLNRLEAAGVIKRCDRRGIALCNVGELERRSGDPFHGQL